jgi:capsular exopolysaccharide synthesis family protein
MAAKFGPAYPKLVEMRSHLDAITDSIHTEVKRVAERAKNDYEVAQQVEDNAREIYLEQKHQADQVNDKTIEYAIARQEADESRNLYESLFRQLKQSGVLAGFRAENISLVDPARVPARPARPMVLLYMVAAFTGGLFLGVGAAVVQDGVDSRIHDLIALEAELGQAPLSILPYYKRAHSRLADKGRSQTLGASNQEIFLWDRSVERKVRIPTLDEPRSGFVEGLRALRTSLLLSKGRIPPQVVLITSSMPGEGKSMVSANFAVILADQQKKVLLVDADLRRPNLHHTFNVETRTGLSWLLASAGVERSGENFEVAARSVIVPVADVSQLFLVPAGAIPMYPAELLSSDRMCRAIKIWRREFDYIVIDGSPVLPVTDAVILSGIADCTLLTARYQVVEQQALLRAYDILRSQAGLNNIGIVLNAVRENAGAYYPRYGYPDWNAQYE